jgi:hypothetical protein
MKKFKAFKKPVDVQFTIYDHAGTENTKEGKVSYKKGDYRMVGVEGEVWPMKPSVFEKNYNIISDGIGRKKKIIVDVEEAEEITYIETSWGAKLKAKPGDFIVSTSPTDCWVVSRDIFNKTYERE